MNEQVVFALLFELWRDIREPAFLWQVLALGMSLLLAWGLSRYGRQQEFVRSTAEHGALRTFSTGSIKRVAFPLLSLLLILIVRKLFKYWHLGPVSLFDLAVPLLLVCAMPLSWGWQFVVGYVVPRLPVWRLPITTRSNKRSWSKGRATRRGLYMLRLASMLSWLIRR